MLLALKMEERAMNQGMQAASEAGKGKETDCSLESPEGTQSCGPILDFWRPELYDNKFLF